MKWTFNGGLRGGNKLNRNSRIYLNIGSHFPVEGGWRSLVGSQKGEGGVEADSLFGTTHRDLMVARAEI